MAYANFKTFMAEYSATVKVAAPLTDFQKSALELHLMRLQDHLQHALVMSVLDNPTPEVLAAAKTIANRLAVDVDFSQIEEYVG